MNLFDAYVLPAVGVTLHLKLKVGYYSMSHIQLEQSFHISESRM